MTALVARARAVRRRWHEFWATPEPVLVAAGAGGEMLVAKSRLVLALLVLLIPGLQLFPFPADKEVFVGLAGAASGVSLAGAVWWIGRRRPYRPWVGFATSLADVSLVSAVLVAFLVMGRPHTAVNSKVIYEIYLLALAATTLRFDPRICVATGLVAIAQYLVIVVYATSRWDLNDPSFAPFSYGMFSWGAQVSRLILLAWRPS